jgi:hypothetical protein
MIRSRDGGECEAGSEVGVEYAGRG